jgi:hypothetical protein
MWGVLLGGLLTIVGGAASVRWVAPWAATYQRAQQRWEDDLVALDDLLAWELPESINDLTNRWNALKWELEAEESQQSQGSVQASGRANEITRRRGALEQAMADWERLAGPRLELLARHVEHRNTSWGERSVLVARAKLYRQVFSTLDYSLDADDIQRIDSELESESETRAALLAYVRSQGSNLWPSKAPMKQRIRKRFAKSNSHPSIQPGSNDQRNAEELGSQDQES